MRRAEAFGFLVASVTAFILLLPSVTFEDQQVARSLSSGPEYWGTSETFANVSMGTYGPAIANDVTLLSLYDIFMNQLSDTVVLDGWVYEMTFGDAVGTAMWYEPSGPADRTDDWNISMEVYRTKEASFYESLGLSVQAGREAMEIYLCNETRVVQAGLRIVTGSQSNETIEIFDSVAVTWTPVSMDVQPSYPHDSESFGLRPDRYYVSFGHSNNSQEVTVTILNTGTGVVYSGNLTIPTLENIIWPKLRVDMNIDTGMVSVYPLSTGWVVDNFMFRSLKARHVLTEPVYEFVEVSDPVWIAVTDDFGKAVSDALVTIEGLQAFFNPVTSRYEAIVPREVDWDVKLNFTVVADGVHISDTLYVTTLMDSLTGIELPRWWNGWDWVSVFGRDDSSQATSADTTYHLFDHPTTSYMSTNFGGNSTDLLARQSEIALHYPHDYRTWGQKPWSDAVISADAGHSMLEQSYTYASRWDDPGYVGNGDMYISLANPGNTASWEMMYAEFLRGTRLEGTGSWTYLGGNSSIIGSYWIYAPSSAWLPSWDSWHPYQKSDLLDMFRSINTDYDTIYQLPVIKMTAENNGVVRFYNHNIVANVSLLDWVTNPKTDFAFENWKATDGEVASYINGRWTTEIKADPSSTTDMWAFNISRRDPVERGYWNVPITVSFDIKDKDIGYVRVVSGSWDLNSSDSTLQYLNKSRRMDTGFDIRNDRLFVSYFWNESTRLEIKVDTLDSPRIVSAGEANATSYVQYVSIINCTSPDNGSSVWSLQTNAPWLTVQSSNDTSCTISGVPETPGVYYANVTVLDGNNTDFLNWSVTVTKQKTVRGQVLNETNGPIMGLLVTVTVMNGESVRTVLTNLTDASGVYTVTFVNDEWFVGDTIIVNTTYDNRTEENSSIATTAVEQELNLQFIPIIPEFGLLRIALVASAIGITIAVVALYWRRRQALRSS